MAPKSIAIAASILLFLCSSAFADGLASTNLFVRLRFWNVPQISTKEVARWLASDSPPILLDVRTEAEYAVSHLPGARRIGPDAQATKTLAGLSPDLPIVTYCAVGYRSAELAQRLITAGRRNVYNMEGSIFQWANEGRPLERESKPVETVHPYNERWGKMLDPRHRAKVPLINE